MREITTFFNVPVAETGDPHKLERVYIPMNVKIRNNSLKIEATIRYNGRQT